MAHRDFFTTHEMLLSRELIAEDQAGGWDKAWIAKATPWDADMSQPPLDEIFKSDEIKLPKVGRALVPGCGKGYDAISIAKHLGLQVTAVDISPTALGLAREIWGEKYPTVSFEESDFFKLKDEPTFDLVSDYTFFQALPPVLRPEWGAKMSSIVKPGGYLVVLAFPTDAPKEVGPPYGFDGDAHASFLGSGWVNLVDRVPTTSSEKHVGKDRLLVFQRE